MLKIPSPLIPERKFLTPYEADAKAVGILGLCMLATLALGLLAWWVTR
jgi:hypothetical protein